MKLLSLALTCLLTITVCAQPTERQERKPLTRTEPERIAKAQELLNQTRAALSQGAKLDAIQTLSVAGKLRRSTFSASRSANGVASIAIMSGDIDPTILGIDSTKEYFAEGKAEYDFSLPGKFHWEEEVQGQHRIGFFDGNRFLQGPSKTALSAPPPAMPMIQQQIKSQFAYLTLGLLLTAPPEFPLEYNYGEEKPFKQSVADVIVLTGPGSFKADLYLDQTTHLPLLLRFVIGGIGRPAGVLMPPGSSQAEGMRALEIAKQQAAAKPPGQQEREKLILFEDYRAVDGVLFPHKITTQINGKLVEVLSFSRFNVNQAIKPEKFAEKK